MNAAPEYPGPSPSGVQGLEGNKLRPHFIVIGATLIVPRTDLTIRMAAITFWALCMPMSFIFFVSMTFSVSHFHLYKSKPFSEMASVVASERKIKGTCGRRPTSPTFADDKGILAVVYE